jgi:hypothetical protein
MSTKLSTKLLLLKAICEQKPETLSEQYLQYCVDNSYDQHAHVKHFRNIVLINKAQKKAELMGERERQKAEDMKQRAGEKRRKHAFTQAAAKKAVQDGRRVVTVFLAVHSARYHIAKRARTRLQLQALSRGNNTCFEYRFFIGHNPVFCAVSSRHSCEQYVERLIGHKKKKKRGINNSSAGVGSRSVEMSACLARFSTGCTAREDGAEEAARKEREEHGDVIELGMVDTYQNLSTKTALTAEWWTRRQQQQKQGRQQGQGQGQGGGGAEGGEGGEVQGRGVLGSMSLRSMCASSPASSPASSVPYFIKMDDDFMTPAAASVLIDLYRLLKQYPADAIQYGGCLSESPL